MTTAARTALRRTVYSPTDLLLNEWLRADTNTLQASGGAAASANLDPVGAWVGKGGSGKQIVQATAANKPYLATGALNGLPVVRFEDTAPVYLNGTAALLGTLPQPYTIAGVMRMEMGTGSGFPFDLASGSGTEVSLYDSGGGRLSLYAGTDVLGPVPPTAPLGGAPVGFCTVILTLAGPVSEARLNGKVYIVGNSGANSLKGIILGCTQGLGNGAMVDWAEFLVVPRALRIDEKLGLERYFTRFWNLPSLGVVKSFYGGLKRADFAATTALTGDATYISGYVPDYIRQRGSVIDRVHVQIGTGGAGFRIKVFRPNGSNYDYVGQSEALTLAAGRNNVTLGTPVSCQPGDVSGIYVPAGATVFSKTNGSRSVLSASGDITATNAFGTTTAGKNLCLDARGTAPWVAYTGDSIAAGHTAWLTWLEGGPSGTANNEPGSYLPGLDARWTNQNHAQGSRTFADIAAGHIYQASGCGAKAIICHCGVNDLARTWAAVQADLNTINGVLRVGQHLFLREILPYTGDTDANAVIARTWNANLATWAAANGATVIVCRNAMGQNRVSTGFNDDLLAAYNGGDGLHPNAAGQSALATLDAAALLAYYGA